MKSLLILALCVPLSAFGGRVIATSWDDDSFNPDLQRTPVWCWAASMSAALRSKGVDIPQESIVQAIYGCECPETLKNPNQLTSLNSRLRSLAVKEGNLSTSLVSTPGKWISWDKFKSEIESGNPFVVAYWEAPLEAHVVVVYGAETSSLGVPLAYLIWDPMRGRRVEAWSSLNQRAWFYVIVRDASLDGARRETRTGRRSEPRGRTEVSTESIGRKDDTTVFAGALRRAMNGASNHFRDFKGVSAESDGMPDMWYKSTLSLPGCDRAYVANFGRNCKMCFDYLGKTSRAEADAAQDRLATQIAPLVGDGWKRTETSYPDGRRFIFFEKESQQVGRIDVTNCRSDDGTFRVQILLWDHHN